MKIFIVSTYPPRSCGIATFTQNLYKSMTHGHGETSPLLKARLIALTDCPDGYDYPAEVEMPLQADGPESYQRLAEYLNRNADTVILQHEYGIYGGQDGAYVLTLLKGLNRPTIVTLHTVLKTPSQSQKYILQQIGSLTSSLVVMTQLAKQFLQEIYQIPAEKIKVIEHGVPDLPMSSREELKRKLGFEGRKMLLTFGLLGRGKGIETAINALPAIVEKHPETLYVILGKTHPAIVRQNGEEYREHLLELARQKGVESHVQFVNSFMNESDLWEYLQACDVYVVPYLNEAQITSGTLSYAVGAGAAVVSTPFWHAQELLSDGKGVLFNFSDSNQLADIISELLSDDAKLNQLRSKALMHGRRMKWSLAGKQYVGLVRGLLAQHVSKGVSNKTIYHKNTTVKLDHLKRLTDSTGMLQHAKYCIPNRFEGYCIDDNARALIVAVMASKSSRDPWLKQATATYLSYMHHCQNEDGTFRNFMSYDRNFLDEVGSEDAFGRAIWALGYAMAHLNDNSMVHLASEMFEKAFPHITRLESPRSVGFSLLGLYHLLKKSPSDERLLIVMDQLRNQLVSLYQENSEDGWHWFEDNLTYSNAILPLALFCTLEILPCEEVQRVAFESTEYLEQLTFEKGYCQPIGCEMFYHKGQQRSYFDQQPLDVMANTLLFLQAYKVTGQEGFYQRAQTCMEWFLGNNDQNLPLYDQETGGCCDGLTKDGVNLNQGAESTLSFHIAYLAIQEAAKLKKTAGKDGQAAGKNGQISFKEHLWVKVA